MNDNFLAIDFETADSQLDSACAIGLVRVKDGKIVERIEKLIRPPRKQVLFTWVHGLTWEHVKDAPTFAEVWTDIREQFDGVDFVVAHNSSFDRRVLLACCEANGIAAPQAPFVCTVQLARSTWGIFPTKLPHVCQHLGISLNHHNALSDAEASATIVLRSNETKATSESGVSEFAPCPDCKPRA